MSPRLDGPLPEPAATPQRRRPPSRWGAWVHNYTQRHSLLLHEGGLWDAGATREPLAPPHHHAGFGDWCVGHTGRVCDLWLSGALVHEMVCDPSLPLSSDTALLEHARAALVHYHGDVALRWPLAAWSARGQQGVSALHRVDVEQLVQQARAGGVRLRFVRPWWVRVLVLALRRAPQLRSHPCIWLLIIEGRFVSALRLHHGALVELRSHWLLAATPAQVQAFVGSLHEGAAERPHRASVCALGYGLAAGDLGAVETLAPLTTPAPAAQWLLPEAQAR